MRVVVLGAKGMLGHDLVSTFKDYDLCSLDKEELDITSKQLVDKKIKSIKPEFVINASGYTDVDGAEANYEFAYGINAEGVKNLAIACKKINCIMLHVSTDYVFDGNKTQGYSEDDEPNPISAYGKSKLLGEKYLKQIIAKHYLVRTSWLYGSNGKNFVDTILNLAKNKKELEVVDDQKGSPTYTKDLSEGVKNIVDSKPEFGTYHLTNDGICTWFEFAKKIIEIKNLNASVNPVTSEQLNRAAKRPKCSVLLNTKLPKLRHWQDALKEYLSKK